jgi:hypothetical protein
MWYVEPLFKTCNAGDWTFYDAIKIKNLKNTGFKNLAGPGGVCAYLFRPRGALLNCYHKFNIIEAQQHVI